MTRPVSFFRIVTIVLELCRRKWQGVTSIHVTITLAFWRKCTRRLKLWFCNLFVWNIDTKWQRFYLRKIAHTIFPVVWQFNFFFGSLILRLNLFSIEWSNTEKSSQIKKIHKYSRPDTLFWVVRYFVGF